MIDIKELQALSAEELFTMITPAQKEGIAKHLEMEQVKSDIIDTLDCNFSGACLSKIAIENIVTEVAHKYVDECIYDCSLSYVDNLIELIENSQEYNLVFMDPKLLYERIKADYMAESTELNGMFFHYRVRMSKADLLDIYTQLQEEINGDDVIIPDWDYSEQYEGYFDDFLEECQTNALFYRITEGERNDFCI